MFQDRVDAGRRLAARLVEGGLGADLVLALPRGGVEVGAEVAAMLDLPLDVLLVRKLGLPGQPELAMGAIGEGGVRVMNPEVVAQGGVSDSALAQVVAIESAELRRRGEAYRGMRPLVEVAGRSVIVVDDGLATGATAEAAVAVLRARGAGRVTVAVPVGAGEAVRRLDRVADEVMCLTSPSPFRGVGGSYTDFTQVDDTTVVRILRRHHPTD